MKNSERKAWGGTQKDKKVQKHKKGAKWHGNEEQMNISVYHMLRSCGVQAGSYPKTEEKMKLIFLASKELSWLWNLGFHFPKLDYPQWFRVHNLPFQKSIYLEEFNMLILLLNSLYSRKKLSRDLGSPGSRQLLQLQLFAPNFLNFGPLLMI